MSSLLDLQLLRIVKHRKEFFQLQGRIPKEALDNLTRTIMDDFGAFFEKMPDADKVDMPSFLPIFRARRSDLGKELMTSYEAILPKLTADVTKAEREGIMLQMLELRLHTEMARLVERYDNGDVANLHAEMAELEMSFAIDAGVTGADYIRTSIEDLLDRDEDNNGIEFRLSCLKEALRPMRGGDFLIVAGRPDKGKTTFLASEVTYWANQLAPERNIVWINNEGVGERIIPRLYQAAIGATMSQIRELRQRGVIRAEYAGIVGRIDRIRIIDAHGFDTYAVENAIRDNNAGIVLFDMIDNIRGFGDAARTDLALERMYQWARELCVKYDMIGIGTSQISNDGDGLQFPTLGMLKDSKTGKQGACDVQLMIGATNDPGQQGLRFIGLPKNKLRREGSPGDPRATVAFSPMRARFEDIEIELESEDE